MKNKSKFNPSSRFAVEKQSMESIRKMTENEKPFSTLNFYMMGGCLVLIVLGFLFMSGGASTVEGGFNPDIFSTRRIVVGPLLSFLGFLLMAFAIIYKPFPRKRGSNKESSVEANKEADVVSN